MQSKNHNTDGKKVATIRRISGLTPTRRDLLLFINRSIELYGMAPTNLEMRRALGNSAPAGIAKLVNHLERGGYVRRTGQPQRNLEITPKGKRVCSARAK